jgi:hypothetical protein
MGFTNPMWTSAVIDFTTRGSSGRFFQSTTMSYLAACRCPFISTLHFFGTTLITCVTAPGTNTNGSVDGNDADLGTPDSSAPSERTDALFSSKMLK